MLPPYIGLNVGSSEIPSLLKDVRGLPCRYSIRSSHSQGERERQVGPATYAPLN